MSNPLKNFSDLTNNVNKVKKSSSSFVKKNHLSRKDRHTIQINNKYYLKFREAAFKNPGTNITEWANFALHYAFSHHIIDKYLK